MKVLSLIVLALLVAVGIALVVLKDPGYVLISYGHWTVETTLSLFILAVIVATLLVIYGARLLRGLWRLPGRVHDWSEHRHQARAQLAFQRATIALTEGRWKSAERDFLRFVRYSDSPMLNYLGAARAAEHLDAPERRDRYLHLAHESAPKAALPVGLTQAELQLAHQQQEQALATLTHLRSLDPANNYVLELLTQLYRDLRDWDQLRELLPQLRRRRVFSDERARGLERDVFTHLMDRQASRGDIEALMRVWGGMPKYLQEEESLLACYVEHLMQAGRGTEAEPLVRAALNRRWSERLARLYGLLAGKDPAHQMEVAEGWARERGKSPMLLLTLGRLAVRNRLWGKARAYLEASLGAEPHAETYKELAALLEHMGEKDKAMSYYREGMMLAVRTSTPLPEAPGPGEGTPSVPALTSQPQSSAAGGSQK